MPRACVFQASEPLQLFHYARMKAGAIGKWFTKPPWQETRQLWAQMSAKAEAAYETLSCVPGDIARASLVKPVVQRGAD
jgi:hypothetical protein